MQEWDGPSKPSFFCRCRGKILVTRRLSLRDEEGELVVVATGGFIFSISGVILGSDIRMVQR